MISTLWLMGMRFGASPSVPAVVTEITVDRGAGTKPKIVKRKTISLEEFLENVKREEPKQHIQLIKALGKVSPEKKPLEVVPDVYQGLSSTDAEIAFRMRLKLMEKGMEDAFSASAERIAEFDRLISGEIAGKDQLLMEDEELLLLIAS